MVGLTGLCASRKSRCGAGSARDALSGEGSLHLRGGAASASGRMGGGSQQCFNSPWVGRKRLQEVPAFACPPGRIPARLGVHDKENPGSSGHGPPTQQCLLAQDQACLLSLVNKFSQAAPQLTAPEFEGLVTSP